MTATAKLIIFLAIGTVAMGIPILVMSKRYQISWWKGVLTTVLLTVVGTVGTRLMYYIENRVIGGLSFYGAVFLVLLVFPIIALLLRVPCGKILDLCAVGECIMLALMKLHCIIGGCCLGRVMFTTGAGTAVRFPSRIVEMITALVIFTILFHWAWKGKNRGILYSLYLLFYGSTRFILNICREAWVTKEMLLPFGNIWSLVAIAVGLVWMLVIRKKNNEDISD